MIKGSAIIMIFYFLGHCVSYLIADTIPSSVCGMILLFIALKIGVVKPKDVKKVAEMLTKNMAIFFVPVGVSIMAYYDIIKANLSALIIASIISTILVALSVGTIQQHLERKSKSKATRNE